MTELSIEQTKKMADRDQSVEEARWGNMFAIGTTKYLETRELLKKTGLIKPQIESIFKALRTGKYKDNVMGAFDDVMSQHVEDVKNTHE